MKAEASGENNIGERWCVWYWTLRWTEFCEWSDDMEKRVRDVEKRECNVRS